MMMGLNESNEPALWLPVTIFKLNIRKKPSGKKNLLLTNRKIIKNASIITKHKIKQLYIPAFIPPIYTCTHTYEFQ